jgi:signal transduction protein with GAF and PtsI domain
MQTERVTILMSSERKASVTSRAAARGISVGEYVRQKVEDDEDELTPEQEAELSALVAEANRAIPAMAASLDSMIETVSKMRQHIRETLDSLSTRA